jgi:hypothetical protein
VNLRDAAVFDVAEATDQCEDVQAELMVRQGEMRLRLGSVGPVEAFTGGVGTASDVQGETDDAVQGGDGAEVAVVLPEFVEADRAIVGDGKQSLRVRRPRP